MPVDIQQHSCHSPVDLQQDFLMPASPADVPYGTLDLMALRTREQAGPLHGSRIDRLRE